MTKLFENVQALCKERNIKSIRQLEISSGLSKDTIKKWKNRLPRCEPLMTLALFFNVTIDHLLGCDNDNLTNDYMLNPNIRKIIEETKSLNIDEHTANITIKIIQAIESEKTI